MTTVIEQAVEVFHRAEYESAERAVALYALKMAMQPTDREVLWQLMFRGPVWDGDIASKTARDRLLDWKLATRCCYKGGQGYTVATYPALSVSEALGLSKDPACLAMGSAKT